MEIFPVIAPTGTTATIEVVEKDVTVADCPPAKVTVGVEEPKFDPDMVTLVPVLPTEGVNPEIEGTDIAVALTAKDKSSIRQLAVFADAVPVPL